MKALDLSPILGEYGGKWVAMTQDRTRVVAHGDKMSQCIDEVIHQGLDTEKVIFTRVHRKGVFYVGRI